MWTPACQEAWEQLKKDMVNCIKLRPFDPDNSNLRTYLIADASFTGIAAYISQGPIDGTWEDAWPIDIYARPLTAAESNYTCMTVLEKEASTEGLGHYEHYLRGLPRFTAGTDHQALLGQPTTAKPSTDHKIARMDTFISTFPMDMIHILGDGNLLADTLSRLWEQYSKSHPPPEAADITDEQLWRWNYLKSMPHAQVQAITRSQTRAAAPEHTEIAPSAEPPRLPLSGITELVGEKDEEGSAG